MVCSSIPWLTSAWNTCWATSCPSIRVGWATWQAINLKRASDPGIPVLAVELLFQQGYFRQEIDSRGARLHYAPFNDPGQLPIRPVRNKAGDWLSVSLAGLSLMDSCLASGGRPQKALLVGYKRSGQSARASVYHCRALRRRTGAASAAGTAFDHLAEIVNARRESRKNAPEYRPLPM